MSNSKDKQQDTHARQLPQLVVMPAAAGWAAACRKTPARVLPPTGERQGHQQLPALAWLPAQRSRLSERAAAAAARPASLALPQHETSSDIGQHTQLDFYRAAADLDGPVAVVAVSTTCSYATHLPAPHTCRTTCCTWVGLSSAAPVCTLLVPQGPAQQAIPLP